MLTLRPYQATLEQEVNAAWQDLQSKGPPPPGGHVVGVASCTGSGKTPLFSHVLLHEPAASVAIAHRKELVGQMSRTLARNGVRHRVIGSSGLRSDIVQTHMKEFGRSFVDANARCGVAGIGTLKNLSPSDPWVSQVRLWVGDEGHHFLRENQWGKGVAVLRNAIRGLLVSATWFRADGKGLGRGVQLPNGKWTNDGLCDRLVVGPRMRELINMGYLTDYRVFAPPSDIDYSDVPVTDSGDLSQQKLRAKVHASKTITGDIVKHYLRIAPGKLGVVFAVDIEEAAKYAAAFNEAGVPAAVISSETPDVLRVDLLKRFARGEIKILCNVDLFGEGFDLPAIEVVIMARKTESKALFDQQFGRVLRLMISPISAAAWDTYTDEQRKAFIAQSDKPYGVIIDHVGNVERHLPPDAPRYQTLDRRERRVKSDAPTDVIPVRTCLNPICLAVYPRTELVCPFCKTKPEPASRSDPKFVDGDLHELDPEVLRKMRGEVERIDRAPQVPQHLDQYAQQRIKNVHYERQQAQHQLRKSIALWGGWQRDLGREQQERERRFYFMFGIDLLSAQALNKADAEALAERVRGVLDQNGIVEHIDSPVILT